MTGKKILILAGVILIVEIVLLMVFKQEMSLPDFQDVPKWNLVKTAENETTFLALNKVTVVMMLIVDVLIITMAYLATRSLRQVPGKIQSFFEIIVDLFSDLVTQTLGENGRRHLPMLGSLFLFLWISNIIGSIPFAEEPTRDLNVPIGHMLAVLTVVHFEAIRIKGLKAYLMSYNEPFIVMMPLNVIGEIAKGVSLAFRLFGNILGGAIIVMVISYLARYVVLPAGLNMFFGIFVGTIQAFVFTMLGMTYIAVAIAD
ncbi:MAG: F0F1 ATP synthase subunit A [Candidatus Latescibacteria bacterium]|nr:F0F1 ATP synthase subunit A [Candidatus Latescibacterota bacterium]